MCFPAQTATDKMSETRPKGRLTRIRLEWGLTARTTRVSAATVARLHPRLQPLQTLAWPVE